MVYHNLHTVYNGEKIVVKGYGTNNYKDSFFEYLYYMKTNSGPIIIAGTKKDGKIVSYCQNKKGISDALNAINSDCNGPFIHLIKENLEKSLSETP